MIGFGIVHSVLDAYKGSIDLVYSMHHVNESISNVRSGVTRGCGGCRPHRVTPSQGGNQNDNIYLLFQKISLLFVLSFSGE